MSGQSGDVLAMPGLNDETKERDLGLVPDLGSRYESWIGKTMISFDSIQKFNPPLKTSEHDTQIIRKRIQRAIQPPFLFHHDGRHRFDATQRIVQLPVEGTYPIG